MILYNGASGGLGRYFQGGWPLRARMEDRDGTRAELAAQRPLDAGEEVTLLQMAARVSVEACEADPEAAFHINVRDTTATVVDFCAWARNHDRQPHVLYVSTGHVYAPSDGPVDERAAVEPQSIYARTKLAAETYVGEAVARAGGTLVVARVFGLVAPVQAPTYLLPSLIRRVERRALADIPGLSYARDYLDARDVGVMLAALAQVHPAEPLTCNVCSGRGVRVRDLLWMVGTALGVDTNGATSAPGRPGDVPYLVGVPHRFVLPPSRSLVTTVYDAVQEARS